MFDSSVLEIIEKLTERRGFPPTIREVMKEADTASFNVMHATLRRLRDAGMVTWEERTSRTLKVVDGHLLGADAPK